VISLPNALGRITSQPARILGIDVGQLTPNAPADICIFDPDKQWQVDAMRLQSQGRNTPFDQQFLKGIPITTLVAGKISYTRS